MDEVRKKLFHTIIITTNTIKLNSIQSRFHSDHFVERSGFQIEYTSLELFTECGGNYSNTSGILTSPSYPNPYPLLADCVYLINLPIETYVNISFINLDISCSAAGSAISAATSDYIELRDGNSEEAPVMGRFCGNTTYVPALFQTTQNFLRIR